MPIELGIWKLTGPTQKPERITFSAPDLEKHLENAIEQDLSIVDETPMLLIGRQIAAWGGAASSKFIDILCIDEEGNLVVMELKRGKTPREVVAQTLDYGAWINTLSLADVKTLFADKNPGKPFETAFEEKFGPESLEALQSLGTSPRLLIVAAELDRETERIIGFLTRSYGVPINAVLFRFWKDGVDSFLSRTWLLDPQEEEEVSAKPSIKSKSGEAWNGRDFYVNLGDKTPRDWDDCREYGFISAGGGSWYSNSLKQLEVGSRVFVYLAGEKATHKGYVGVGIVTHTVQPIQDVKVERAGQEVPFLSLPFKTDQMGHDLGDAALHEYVVLVRWLKAVPREEAFKVKGLFAKQNTVCKLRQTFTLETLAQHFQLGEGEDVSGGQSA